MVKYSQKMTACYYGEQVKAVLNYAKAHNINVLIMEDGFIRSVGLGSNLVAPFL